MTISSGNDSTEVFNGDHYLELTNNSSSQGWIGIDIDVDLSLQSNVYLTLRSATNDGGGSLISSEGVLISVDGGTAFGSVSTEDFNRNPQNQWVWDSTDIDLIAPGTLSSNTVIRVRFYATPGETISIDNIIIDEGDKPNSENYLFE